MSKDLITGRVTFIWGKRYMWLYSERGNLMLGYVDDSGDSDDESDDGRV